MDICLHTEIKLDNSTTSWNFAYLLIHHFEKQFEIRCAGLHLEILQSIGCSYERPPTYKKYSYNSTTSWDTADFWLGTPGRIIPCYCPLLLLKNQTYNLITFRSIQRILSLIRHEVNLTSTNQKWLSQIQTPLMNNFAQKI